MKYWECPDLIVEEKALPKELMTKEAFEKKEISPLNGGVNSRLHENIVEYYVFDDDDAITGSEFIPLITKKFVTYEKQSFFPGLHKITLIYGQKQRKNSDWRFTERINVQKDEAFFLYDYTNKQYRQVNPEKSEWMERMYERELIRKEAIKFILYYQELKEFIWLRKQNPINKNLFVHQFSKEINELDQKLFIETMNFFLKLSVKYIFVLQYFGLITKDEYHYLFLALERQKERQNKCYEYIVLEEENLVHELKEFLNLPNTHPFYETRYRMERLLVPRKERIEDLTPFNYMEGYIYIDTEKGICYPNISEITRKTNLYEMAGNKDSEKEIEKRIIDIAKKQENKK
ncbi:hypothetical protein V7128_26765, partial [Neobacillus vireti]|uniref:hypothetical protein n=1 Tax=Neobacillus vireti TaxID=220686 RepID=UPI002FFEDB64